jgi:hypothetical protein
MNEDCRGGDYANADSFRSRICLNSNLMAAQKLTANSLLFKLRAQRSDSHVFKTRFIGGDSRRWSGDGSDNDRGGCGRAGEE